MKKYIIFALIILLAIIIYNLSSGVTSTLESAGFGERGNRNALIYSGLIIFIGILIFIRLYREETHQNWIKDANREETDLERKEAQKVADTLDQILSDYSKDE
jgi:hypothetical protein